MIKILYFSWLREKVGKQFEYFDCPEEVKTVADLADRLQKVNSVEYCEAFKDMSLIRAAVDCKLCSDMSETLDGASEVAFFPPITGG